MKKLDHPNIVKLKEVIEDRVKNKYYMVMEYCHHGSILSTGYFQSYLRTHDSDMYGSIFAADGSVKNKSLIPLKLPVQVARKYFREIALALDYMHNYA